MKNVSGGGTYVIHQRIQIENIVLKALVLPAGTIVLVRIGITIISGCSILDDVVQLPQLLENLAADHIFVAILRYHNDSPEAT